MLKSKNKISKTKLLELQYADDCAVVADSPESIQEVLSYMAVHYKQLGLNINVQKTEFLKRTVSSPESPIILNIDGTELNEVQCFRYLGSNISANCSLDDEVSFRIGRAASAYGRLRPRVFENHNLNLHTKVSVYHAVVVSTLLYGNETWTLYRQQFRNLEKFHMGTLQKILGITWRDKIPHTEILRRTNCVSLECLLHRGKLRWLGHVVRMPENRLPKQLLYGELAEGRRSVVGQMKRFKDHAKRTLKACHLEPKALENQAADRQEWRRATKAGLASFEADRTCWLNERRERRHREAQLQLPGTDLTCPECGRRCASRIGLISHLGAHQRRRQAEGAVIVGHDGPP